MKAGHHADHEGVGTVLAGGTPAVSYGQSVLLASVYLVAGLAVSLVVITRRDVTD